VLGSDSATFFSEEISRTTKNAIGRLAGLFRKVGVAEMSKPQFKIEYEFCADCGFEVCQCDDFDSDEGFYDEFDCGMGRDGLCGKAGSEECDFECPYRNVKGN